VRNARGGSPQGVGKRLPSQIGVHRLPLAHGS
jgi:hypothetical protein